MPATSPVSNGTSAGAISPAPSRRRSRTSVLLRQLAAVTRENQRLRAELGELSRLREMAYRDPLTGLWNRRYFDERLAEEVARASRDPRRPLSLMLVDVNGLKRVNDGQGHSAGDRVLGAVAAYLRSSLRGHDICCRIGGDEFAVIFPAQGGPACRQLLGRLAAGLLRQEVVAGIPHDLSLGLAALPPEGATPETFMHAADLAMYRDKQRQRGKDPAAHLNVRAAL